MRPSTLTTHILGLPDFAFRDEPQTDEPLLKFELTLIDGHLKGEAKGEHEGRTMKATLDLQRKVE